MSDTTPETPIACPKCGLPRMGDIDLDGSICPDHPLPETPTVALLDNRGNQLVRVGDEVENDDARFFVGEINESQLLCSIDKSKPWTLKNENSPLATCIRKGNYSASARTLRRASTPETPTAGQDGGHVEMTPEEWLVNQACSNAKDATRLLQNAFRERDALAAQLAQAQHRNTEFSKAMDAYEQQVQGLEQQLAQAQGEASTVKANLAHADEKIQELQQFIRYYMSAFRA